MTAEQLQQIVRRLANHAWVRYSQHWNYPEQRPWLMAIGVWMPRDRDIVSFETMKDVESDLLKLGFVLDAASGFYFIERTNEDGTPYTSPP